MRVVDLMRGVAAGYAVQGLQLVASLVVLPLLLSDRGLGIARYGHAYTILFALSLFSVLTDGFKVSLSRSIARAMESPGETPGRYIWPGIVVLGLSSAALAAALYFGRETFLRLLGLPFTSDYETSVGLAALMLFLGQTLYVFEAHILARGHLDSVNAVQAIEVVTRNAFYLGYFAYAEASVAVFIGAMLVGNLLRQVVCTALSVTQHSQDLAGIGRIEIGALAPVARYSLPISISTAPFFVLQRLSLPLVNRFVGGEAAGLFALVMNTSDVYLRRVLLSVIQPILVPLAARLRLTTLSIRRKNLILDIDAVYGAATLALTIPFVALIPFIVQVWLGADVTSVAIPLQVMVGSVGLQLSLALRRSLLIGQDLAGLVATRSGAIGMLATALVIWAVVVESSWKGAAYAIAFYLVASSTFSVGQVFERRLFQPEARARRGTMRLLVSGSIGYLAAVALSSSISTGSAILWLSVAAASVAVSLIVIHHLLVPLPTIVRTLMIVSESPRRDLFAEG